MLRLLLHAEASSTGEAAPLCYCILLFSTDVVYHHTFQLAFFHVLASGGDCNAAGAQAGALRTTTFHGMHLLWQKVSYVLHIVMHAVMHIMNTPDV